VKAATLAPARPAILDYLSICKPRLTAYVLMVVWAGAALASRGTANPWVVLHAILGTALVASGASALNMVLERRWDQRMRRTCDRAIAAGRVPVRDALLFAGAAGSAGTLELLVATTPLAALLAFLTTITYVGAYTPLKRRTTLNTQVGAIPGALPALIGWTATGRPVDGTALALFFVLFLWQIPHFLAIAWIHREDYTRGGFRMLSTVDPTGALSGRQAVVGTAALAGVSLLPGLVRVAGPGYVPCALLVGAFFTAAAVRFALRRDAATARGLLRASLLHLPALLLCLLLCSGVL
jgi:protoheme IX farnesyltransferase